MLKNGIVDRSIEVRFASLHSGGIITAIVVNPPERKLAERTSVHRAEIFCSYFGRNDDFINSF